MRRTLTPAALGLFILASVGVRADTVSCLDNLDCRKGEVCLDDGDGPTGTCTARCAPLRMQLVVLGKEPSVSSRGTFTRYKLAVTNWRQFPDALFALAPDLPACGLNTNAARSWVDIFDDATAQRIYGFCGLSAAKDLTSIWFAVEQGTAPPANVHIRMTDRRTGKNYCSNAVAVPTS